MHVCVCLWRTNERRAQCIHTSVYACLYVCMYCIDYDYKFNWMPPERSRNGNPIGRAGAREHAYALALSLCLSHTRLRNEMETKRARNQSAQRSFHSIPREGWHTGTSERALSRSQCRVSPRLVSLPRRFWCDERIIFIPNWSSVCVGRLRRTTVVRECAINIIIIAIASKCFKYLDEQIVIAKAAGADLLLTGNS